MQAYGQAAGASQHWARVELVRGQSGGAVWQVDQNVPQARLAIGSDASAGWPVSAPGVRPVHLELYWDGRALFVADSQRAGGVTVNGAPIGQEWVPVRGRSEISFGQASLRLETSGEAPASLLSDPSIARRISLTPELSSSDINAESTRIAESSFDPPSLAGERTMIAEELSVQIPAAVPPPPGRAPAPPPPPPMARPRLGGNAPAGGGHREQVRTLTAEPVASPEATRMLSLDEVPAGQLPMLGGAPGSASFGGGAPAGAPSFGSGAAPAFPQQPGGSASGFGGVTAPPPAPSLQAPPAAGGFAAPPSFEQAASAQIRSTPKVPPRTIALGAIAVVAVLGVVFLMGGPAEEELVDVPVPVAPGPGVPPGVAGAPIAPMPGVPTAPMPGAPVAGAIPTPGSAGISPVPMGAGIPALPAGPASPPGAAPILPLPMGAGIPPLPPVAIEPVLAAPPAALSPPPAATSEAPVVDPATLPPTEDRLAADLIVAGRYAEALPRYQALAAAHPERPEYAAMAGVLTERLRAMSCIGGLTPDGRPCTTGGVP